MVQRRLDQPKTVGHIVRFKQSVVDVPNTVTRLAGKYRIPVHDMFRESVKGFSTNIPEVALANMSREVDIEAIEPDFEVEAYQYVPWGISRIGCTESSVAPGTRASVDARIFIFDTGVQRTHPDINIVESLSFVRTERNTDDMNGHGTMCAGVAAARDNLSHVVGVAPSAKIHSYKVLAGNGSGSLSNLISAMDRVIQVKKQNPDNRFVVNMSLGAFVGTTAYNTADMAVRNAIVNHNITVVIAAGNSGIDAALVSPGHVQEAITVGSYNVSGNFSSFSNYGSTVDILAPGENILTTSTKSSTAIVSGTSFSAPHVAGVAALYLSLNPSALPQDVLNFLKTEAAAAQTLGTNSLITNAPFGTTNYSVYAGNI